MFKNDGTQLKYVKLNLNESCEATFIITPTEDIVGAYILFSDAGTGVIGTLTASISTIANTKLFDSIEKSVNDTISQITNKAKFEPPISNEVFSGTLYSNENRRGCVFRVEKGVTYKITVSGNYNRFAIGGATEDACVDGTPITTIQAVFNATADGQTREYTFTNTDYNFIVVNLAVLSSNFSAENFTAIVEVEKNPNTENFTVNGIDVVAVDALDTYFPAELTAKTQQGKIGNTASSGGTVVRGEKYTACVFKAKENTLYKITIKGLHNRFYVHGYANEVLTVGDATTSLYNSGNTSEREQDESCTINSGENKNIIVTVGYQMSEPSVSVEYCVMPNDDGVVKFDGFDLYTGEKIDGLLMDSSASTAYVTKRNVSDVSTANEVYALYDALVAKYPAYITKNTLGQNSLGTPIYEYIFTSGNYNDVTVQRLKDDVIQKPVILVLSGVHGYERSAVMSTYQFFRDMAEFVPSLYALREELTFKVVPVVTPYSFDNDSRVNENGVNINRNSNYNWELTDNDGNNYSGEAVADQAETQIVQAWIDNNSTAYLLIDHHNSGYVNEISMILANSSATHIPEIKEQYLKGVSKVIPFWKDKRGFPDTLIFAYTGSLNDVASLFSYSQSKGIPSICMETSWNTNSLGKHSTASIAVGAEAFGNMLLGIHKEL